MATTTIQAPLVNLVASTMMRTEPVMNSPNMLMSRERCIRRRSSGRSSVRRCRFQCRTMPSWLIVKETNTPMMYSWIRPLDVRLVDDHQDDGEPGEREDAVAERQAVAARVELPWQVAVAGQHRPDHREAVERRVRGQREDRRGRHRDDETRVDEWWNTASAICTMTVFCTRPALRSGPWELDDLHLSSAPAR